MNAIARCLIFVAILSGPSWAMAATYTFSQVFSGTSYTGVAINDNGLVALKGYVDGRQRLITTDGHTSTYIYNYDIPMQVLSLNNSGVVAFRNGFLENATLYASDGTTTREVAYSDEFEPKSFFRALGPSAMSINDSGVIAFQAWKTGDPFFQAFVSNGTATPTPVNNQLGQSPAMNNVGVIAYVNYFEPGTGIEIQRDGQTLSLPGTPIGPQTPAMPDINNSGVVAFPATVDGVEKIVIGDGLSTPSYIDAIAFLGGLTSGYAFDGGPADCAINDQGLVVFGACRDAQGVGYGLFFGPDPISDKLIMVGDSLGDATVTSLGFARNGLNNAGQVAFCAQLSDGTMGVWVATPTPEPATGVLLAVGCLGVLGCVWQKRFRRNRLHGCGRHAGKASSGIRA